MFKADIIVLCIAMLANYTLLGVVQLFLFALLLLPIVLMFMSGNVVGIVLYTLIVGCIIGACKDVLR